MLSYLLIPSIIFKTLLPTGAKHLLHQRVDVHLNSVFNPGPRFYVVWLRPVPVTGPSTPVIGILPTFLDRSLLQRPDSFCTGEVHRASSLETDASTSLCPAALTESFPFKLFDPSPWTMLPSANRSRIQRCGRPSTQSCQLEIPAFENRVLPPKSFTSVRDP